MKTEASNIILSCFLKQKPHWPHSNGSVCFLILLAFNILYEIISATWVKNILLVFSPIIWAIFNDLQFHKCETLSKF